MTKTGFQSVLQKHITEFHDMTVSTKKIKNKNMPLIFAILLQLNPERNHLNLLLKSSSKEMLS